MSVILTDATEDDLPALLELQIASWRRAYHGLLPSAFLGAGVEEFLGKRWASLPGDGWIVLAAHIGDDLAGLATVDLYRDTGAYLDNLHVAAWAQRRGIGLKLMGEIAMRLSALEIPRLWLTVMGGNTGARAFYQSIGGQEGPGEVHRRLGPLVFSLPVEWLDLPRLAVLCTGNRGHV